ncbi:MAG: hypothetical protein EA349_14765 [Halomonadaceae bacterium]|nr:MAG: hypothetical protein EA349_14765 [Halomonadaceae bacterium]
MAKSIIALVSLPLVFATNVMADDDMDVTMEMVRDDAALQDFVVHEMALPTPASETGREASRPGLDRAEEARERGRQRSEEARERAREAREQRGRQRDLPQVPERGPGAGSGPPGAGPR